MKAKLVHIIMIFLLFATTIIPIINAVSEINTKSDDNWHYLPSYTNYAPNGLPDFCQRQHQWRYIYQGENGIADSIATGDDIQITPFGESPSTGDPVIVMGPDCYLETIPEGDDYEFWNYCFIVSVANCLWWLDSKYENPNGTAGDGIDDFPLVEDYEVGDDHIPENAPLLICEIANRHGTASYNTTFTFSEFDQRFEEWMIQKGIGNTFVQSYYEYPTFDLIAEEVLQNKPVILNINFFKKGDEYYEFYGNHWVSVAGVNVEEMKIAFSDPFLDINNPIDNEDFEESTTHNNPSIVSHDTYQVAYGTPFSNDYLTKCWLPDYWPYYDFSQISWAMIIDELQQTYNPPLITGPDIARTGKEYSFMISNTDPNLDEVSYFIDWGDNTTSDWTDFYSSNEQITMSHIWEEKLVNTIRVKCKDRNNVQSRWGEHVVSLKKGKGQFCFTLTKFICNYPLLMDFFERFGIFHDIEFEENQLLTSSMNTQIQTTEKIIFYDSPFKYIYE